ncbi:hypothetical protein H0H81_001832 [Sphagnurus paluster]|uniref:Uncharacterized protein n=1 Tax=Sphagnurus paluster TaxID=117069 RepID=A0A9P7GFU9_9AGAR|nr:hypothetical protein H0H81_001832 [Sphagnurus paluster]
MTRRASAVPLFVLITSLVSVLQPFSSICTQGVAAVLNQKKVHFELVAIHKTPGFVTNQLSGQTLYIVGGASADD